MEGSTAALPSPPSAGRALGHFGIESPGSRGRLGQLGGAEYSRAVSPREWESGANDDDDGFEAGMLRSPSGMAGPVPCGRVLLAVGLLLSGMAMMVAWVVLEAVEVGMGGSLVQVVAR